MARSVGSHLRAGFTLVELLIAGTVAAILAGTMAYLLSDVLHLASSARAGHDLRKEGGRAVSLIRSDITGAAGILAAAGDSLLLLTHAGDTVLYSPDPLAPDTLRRRLGAVSGAVSAGLDSAQFRIQTASRTHTREEMAPIHRELLHVSFEPGDWDDWASSNNCWMYEPREYGITDRKWCAQAFWESPSCFGFTRASVRVRARDRIPPDVDLILEIYEASAGAGGHPDRLLGHGKISRHDLTEEYDWHTVNLLSLSPDPVFPEGHYWLVVRPDGQGAQSYAGHLEYQLMTGCPGGSFPANGMCFRESGDAGNTWGYGSFAHEAFFRVYAWHSVDRLTEVTRTLTDTLGISYALSFRSGDEEVRRAGFVALRNR